jgi:hypothetical protein
MDSVNTGPKSYADVNLHKPSEYSNYEALEINFG